MITFIIKTYLSTLLTIGTGSIMLFTVGLYWIWRREMRKVAIISEGHAVHQVTFGTSNAPLNGKNNAYTEMNEPQRTIRNIAPKRNHVFATAASEEIADLHAIAGDHIVKTQLDLARAYIETGKNEVARKILETIVDQGEMTDKLEVQRLLNLL